MFAQSATSNAPPLPPRRGPPPLPIRPSSMPMSQSSSPHELSPTAAAEAAQQFTFDYQPHVQHSMSLPPLPPSHNDPPPRLLSERSRPPPLPTQPRPQQTPSPQPSPNAIASERNTPPYTPPEGDSPNRQTQTDEARTVTFYLKQAIEAADHKSIASLVDRAHKLRINDPIVQSGEGVINQKRSADIDTLTFYLRQGIETKNRETLKTALTQLEPIIAQMSDSALSEQHGALFVQIADARKIIAGLDKDSAQTLAHYLRQGINMKNREVLQQSLGKAQTLPLNLVDKDLITSAQASLAELDAQHLIKFYLTTAIKQKDELALSTALDQGAKLKMGNECIEMVEGRKLLEELRSKPKRNFLGRKKKNKNKGNNTTLTSTYGTSHASSSSSSSSTLFGSPLSEAVRRCQAIDPSLLIPKVCYDCMKFIRSYGLTEPGLFRVPGSSDEMERIRHDYEDMDDVKLSDVNSVAGVLKLYVRMLPEPIIPFDSYRPFIAAGSIKGNIPERNTQLRSLIQTLPPDNRALLTALIQLLVEVSQNSSINKMSADNLAIVWAPNLLRPKEETPQTMLYDMPVSISIVATFVQYAADIFGLHSQANMTPQSYGVSDAKSIGNGADRTPQHLRSDSHSHLVNWHDVDPHGSPKSPSKDFDEAAPLPVSSFHHQIQRL